MLYRLSRMVEEFPRSMVITMAGRGLRSVFEVYGSGQRGGIQGDCV